MPGINRCINIRKSILGIAALALVLTLTACFRITAEELYELPRASDEYFKLQMRIDEVRATGAEYSSPTGGENRSSVQLVDIDGDGISEVVAFFIVQHADNPLKIYIFRTIGDDYEVADIIEGVGAGIESIRYVDLDNDGTLEFIVGWQMGASLKHMSLYSVRGLRHVKLADADYSQMTVADLNGDSSPDIALIRLGTTEVAGELETFALMPDGEVVGGTAKLTEGVESISRMLAGKLYDGTPALFIDGKLTSGAIVTDIFCYEGDAMRSVVRSAGDNELYTRTRDVFSTDINRDGIIEVPSMVLLPQQSETSYYSLEWFSVTSDGRRRLALSTYHNYSDDWYLILPPSWQNKLTVRRDDTVYGERALVFSFVGEGPDTVYDFLIIYMLSGDNREERSQIGNRFRLLVEGDRIYAAEILEPSRNDLPAVPDIDGIRESFRRIYSDWLAGT